MNKRRGISEVSAGVLDGLAALDNDSRENIKTIEADTTEEPKKDEHEKIKRSYMLYRKQIKKVTMLKAILEINDLSKIVRNAIDLYYKEITGEDDIDL